MLDTVCSTDAPRGHYAQGHQPAANRFMLNDHLGAWRPGSLTEVSRDKKQVVGMGPGAGDGHRGQSGEMERSWRGTLMRLHSDVNVLSR